MSTKLYCQVTGVVLLALAALGIVGFGIPGILSVSGPNQMMGDLILGALAAYAGFRDHSKTEMYAKVFSIVILLLGVGGFLVPSIINMDLGSNLLHIGLGVYGIYVGYMVKESQMAEGHA